MSAPNDKEKLLIQQFRARVQDVLLSEAQNSDSFLLRWIRARESDLEKADQMLRKSLQWREELDVDNILNKPFDSWFSQNFPYWIDSTDKWGHPVLEIPLGAWDIRRAMDHERESQFEGHICRFFEDIMRCIRESNERRGDTTIWPITQWTVIVDWKGYSYAQLLHWKALQNTLKMAGTMEAHFPEILYRGYFINCPAIFPIFMGLLKQVIAPKTMEKIHCLGGQDVWGPILQTEIDPASLGHLYGGTRIRKVDGKKYNYPGK